MSKCTIVINTCDAYNDVWELFFKAFEEYWPDCEYNIVLNTEKIKCNLSNVTTHTFNETSTLDNWGKRFKQTLQDIDSDFVIMLYDDFILEGNVNKNKIKQCIKWLEDEKNKDICAFYFIHSQNKNIDDGKFEGFERLPLKADYKLNSAPAIWKKDKLISFIEDNDSPWAWEYFGSYRTYNKQSIFYSIKKENEDIYPYNYSMGGAIYRSKWVSSVVLPLVDKYKLDLDLSKRGLTDKVGGSNKRTLKWKIDFFITGYKMIGLGVFLFAYRIIIKKIGVFFG
ncbi:hypothetical protein CP985_11050 [Malaciobacter mytili LMG 24559]|uniref:Glycosyltransferase, family 2 n=1 Tax=Malaciobacter mytili LMG 24559 TaxID=1032238 RepID=A0AAX2AHI6_9BACT|nr:hypothetical protein [Malaciobacter mytili]AXH14463.1 hypothetical protein AMYT_0872 [Malaciobacter mytili LMG 24559]RXK14966.1 hypothetical protein CP985_11050 [Malaciobacter mytili LMG 24559]